jgi:hypothetical protein
MNHTQNTVPANSKAWRNLIAKCKRHAEKTVEAGRSNYNAHYIDAVLDKCSDLIGGYGVEAINGRYCDGFYQTVQLLYVNMGDTYDTTLCFDTEREKLFVGCWGDWVEKYSDERELD